jgi:hypothetical protein
MSSSKKQIKKLWAIISLLRSEVKHLSSKVKILQGHVLGSDSSDEKPLSGNEDAADSTDSSESSDDSSSSDSSVEIVKRNRKSRKVVAKKSPAAAVKKSAAKDGRSAMSPAEFPTEIYRPKNRDEYFTIDPASHPANSTVFLNAHGDALIRALYIGKSQKMGRLSVTIAGKPRDVRASWVLYHVPPVDTEHVKNTPSPAAASSSVRIRAAGGVSI